MPSGFMTCAIRGLWWSVWRSSSWGTHRQMAGVVAQGAMQEGRVAGVEVTLHCLVRMTTTSVCMVDYAVSHCIDFAPRGCSTPYLRRHDAWHAYRT